ncbi:MAG TPA: SSI family serine proteinase inhibitor [Gaiella sp.]|jgi:hypothetical protein
MRTLGALLALAGSILLAPAAGAAEGRTELRIAYREDARRQAPPLVWTLRCDPSGGTHPSPARACEGLARVGRDAFRPVPPQTACTEIYGGPQTAVVAGTVDGKRVWTRLRRDNGCEIARWDRLRFLIPARPGVR